MKQFIIVLVIAATAFALHLSSQEPAGGFAPAVAARVRAAPVSEMSGIVKSLSWPGVYWVHNDSGDTARIFAIDGSGAMIIPTYSPFSYYGEEREDGKEQWPGFEVLEADNVDWEDMTVDGNYLYVADTGNNFNNRRDLGIYVLSEPDPTASTRSAAIRHLPVSYPQQTEYPGGGDWHFDSESLFSADGYLYLITKHREKGRANTMAAGANLYRLDTDYTDRDNPLALIDHHPDITAATGAELSPDGATLAVITYTALWLFDRPAQGDAWLSAPARGYPLNTEVLRQVEAVTWEDDGTIILTNEQRDIFRISLAELAQADLIGQSLGRPRIYPDKALGDVGKPQ